MQNRILFAAVLSFAASAALASEPAPTSQNTPDGYHADESTGRAERTIASYVKAWASRDAHTLNRVMTEDAVVDFALDEPGTFLTVEAAALIEDCASCAALQPGARIASLRVFPTNDPQAVFVQYETTREDAPGLTESQLALIEFRGERIARVRNFSEAPVTLVARQSPQATHASLTPRAARLQEKARR